MKMKNEAVFLIAVGLIAFVMVSLTAAASYAGRDGCALEFVAETGANVMIPHADVLSPSTNNITVEAWIKPALDQNTIVSKDDWVSYTGYVLLMGTGDQLFWRVCDPSTWSRHSMYAGVAEADVWQHVAGTYDGSSMKVYKDGKLMGIVTHEGAHIGTNKLALRIGCRANMASSAQDYTGVVDEVRIWDKACTQEEIVANMGGELTGSEEGLVGYWRFNEGTGTIAYDSTPNGNDGTIIGASWTTDAAPITPVLLPPTASNPSPSCDALDVPYYDVVLGWTADKYAVTHDVYVGTSFDDVDDATLGSVAYVGNQTDVTCLLGDLALETTYYWRIDEINDAEADSPWKGEVWNFTTETVGCLLPTEVVTATASSVSGSSGAPQATANGAGLTNDLHDTQSSNMWLCDVNDTEPWIRYDFDKVYKLHEMRVWNYNESGSFLGCGIKDAKIEVSVNGEDWTEVYASYELSQAPGGYAANTVVPMNGALAKAVRITALSNWNEQSAKIPPR